MNIFSFSPSFNDITYADRDILSVFRQGGQKSTEIHQGMSPVEISEIVSDNLISVIKEQFETTKENFQKPDLHPKAVVELIEI